MIEFFNTEKQIKISDIEAIESQINLIFPKEYKEHLLRYNGGQCSPNTFEFVENNKTTHSDVDWFLAIYDGEYDSLMNYVNSLKIESKRLPIHIFPIAHDSGGNLICISCGSIDYGYIYFWDHENEIDYSLHDDYNYQNLYLISRNLDHFFELLK